MTADHTNWTDDRISEILRQLALEAVHPNLGNEDKALAERAHADLRRIEIEADDGNESAERAGSFLKQRTPRGIEAMLREVLGQGLQPDLVRLASDLSGDDREKKRIAIFVFDNMRRISASRDPDDTTAKKAQQIMASDEWQAVVRVEGSEAPPTVPVVPVAKKAEMHRRITDANSEIGKDAVTQHEYEQLKTTLPPLLRQVSRGKFKDAAMGLKDAGDGTKQLGIKERGTIGELIRAQDIIRDAKNLGIEGTEFWTKRINGVLKEGGRLDQAIDKKDWRKVHPKLSGKRQTQALMNSLRNQVEEDAAIAAGKGEEHGKEVAARLAKYRKPKAPNAESPERS